MAERRMFAKTIVLSDAFLDMPMTARCLYFTLGMLSDDDGFVNAPRSIMRQCGASDDDMKVLISKKFVLAFESGVIVIKHWRINNYLQKDRYHETKYVEEKSKLSIDEKGGYHRKEQLITGEDVYTGVYTQDRLELVQGRLEEESIVQDNNNNSFSLSKKEKEEKKENDLSAVMSFFLDHIEPQPYAGHVDFVKASIESKGPERVLDALKKCVEDGKTSFPRIVKAVNEA